MTKRVLMSNSWMTEVARALEIDSTKIRRIVIDAEANQALKVYVELWGDERLLTVALPPREEMIVISQGVSA